MGIFFTLFTVLIAIGAIYWGSLENSPPNLQSTSPLQEIRRLACSSAVINVHAPCMGFAAQRVPQLALGFANVIDYRIRSHTLLSLLQPPAVAKYHPVITSEADLAETIASLFERGMAGEFKVAKPVYDKLIKAFEQVPDKLVALGGNGATMAQRLAWEGIKTELVGPVSHLMLPFLPGVTVATPILDDTDIHLVIEYKEGDTWGSYRAFRSNRFYMNADTLNTDFTALQGFYNISAASRIVSLGGLHLVQDSPQFEAFIDQTLVAVAHLKSQGKVVHCELGDFHNNKFYERLNEVLTASDSLGMNEQELGKLLAILAGNPFTGYPAKPELSQLLSDLGKLLDITEKRNQDVSRLHLHSINSQVVCSTDQWTSPVVSAARAALLAPQFACNSTDIQMSQSSLYSGSFSAQLGGASVAFEFDDTSVHKCWTHSKFECCVVLVPTCLNVVGVTGLGDSLSAVGLGYHNLK